MPIDSALYNSPATRGDVAGLAINASVALFRVAEALQAIQTDGKPTAEQIKHVRDLADRLNTMFDTLTGFTQ